MTKVYSVLGLVGGGQWPRPGELSLAHHGVLFLDEVPEFGTRVLEVMRQPMEDRVVTISRAQGTLTFPANSTLVAAMNPFPSHSSANRSAANWRFVEKLVQKGGDRNGYRIREEEV